MDPDKLRKAADSAGGSDVGSDSVADRRDFLSTFSTVAMVGGLAAGYGTFAALAVRYVFPTDVETPWLYVAGVDSINPGDSIDFESPTGVKVTIARRAVDAPETSNQADDFVALSSICPHLGCRVHWEPHNRRFFCPCHNGVFDPEGLPVSGPPKAAGQELSRYPLKVEGGLLFIAMSVESVGSSSGRSHQIASPFRPSAGSSALRPEEQA